MHQAGTSSAITQCMTNLHLANTIAVHDLLRILEIKAEMKFYMMMAV